jgi:hypothetical protein
MPSPKFSLGTLAVTAGALAAIERTSAWPLLLLARHMSGDWGDLGDHDRRLNDLALRHDERILSAYALTDGTRIYVITEADRYSTRILLPEEY